MTITCIYPDDMSILEDKLIDALTDIAIQKWAKALLRKCRRKQES